MKEVRLHFDSFGEHQVAVQASVRAAFEFFWFRSAKRRAGQAFGWWDRRLGHCLGSDACAALRIPEKDAEVSQTTGVQFLVRG
jgi:hypothetical protein